MGFYTPVNSPGNGNPPFPIGNMSSNAGFSIAMLVRRVFGMIFCSKHNCEEENSETIENRLQSIDPKKL